MIFCWGLGFLTRLKGFGFAAASATRVGLGKSCTASLRLTRTRDCLEIVPLVDPSLSQCRGIGHEKPALLVADQFQFCPDRVEVRNTGRDRRTGMQPSCAGDYEPDRLLTFQWH